MQGRGSSSQSSSSSSPLPRQIPSDISCLISYEPLEPNYQKQAIRRDPVPNGFWAPPNKRSAYHRNRTPAKRFRWRGGRMTEVQLNPSSLSRLTKYSVATIFTQYPDTNHLLAVDFDAEEKDVRENPGGWKVLSFLHKTQQPQQGIERKYSYVTVWGDEQQMAAPGYPRLVSQLIPSIYEYDHGQATTRRPTSAGLIGLLPILFALPAFSAPTHRLAQVLTGQLRPNTWIPHPPNSVHGRM